MSDHLGLPRLESTGTHLRAMVHRRAPTFELLGVPFGDELLPAKRALHIGLLAWPGAGPGDFGGPETVVLRYETPTLGTLV
jgi:hypothetical protein